MLKAGGFLSTKFWANNLLWGRCYTFEQNLRNLVEFVDKVMCNLKAPTNSRSVKMTGKLPKNFATKVAPLVTNTP